MIRAEPCFSTAIRLECTPTPDCKLRIGLELGPSPPQLELVPELRLHLKPASHVGVQF